eukprot:3625840-Rhodomonas_salina.6
MAGIEWPCGAVSRMGAASFSEAKRRHSGAASLAMLHARLTRKPHVPAGSDRISDGTELRATLLVAEFSVLVHVGTDVDASYNLLTLNDPATYLRFSRQMRDLGYPDITAE